MRPLGGRVSIAALEAQLRCPTDRIDWDCWHVYADWLADRGDVRSTLVAIEHRLDTEELHPSVRRALRAQIDAVAESHREEWLAGFSPPEGMRL